MYVRVLLAQGVDEKALMVPQQALQRTADGQGALMLVKDGAVRSTPVTTGPAINGKWMITSGLSAGDVVVVEGFQKIRPGAPVQPIPWEPNKKGQSDQQAQGQPSQAPAEGGQAAGQDGGPAGQGAEAQEGAAGQQEQA